MTKVIEKVDSVATRGARKESIKARASLLKAGAPAAQLAFTMQATMPVLWQSLSARSCRQNRTEPNSDAIMQG